MLELKVVIETGFNEDTSEFIDVESRTIRLEHSLVSLSKWESKWEKAFLDNKTEKTPEMFMDYIRFMLLDPDDEPYIHYLSVDNVQEINNYMSSSQTAAWFNDNGRKGGSSKIVTSDLIYYWLVALTIPFDCETWHLNRILTLVRITDLENQPKKKMPRRESNASHRSINQARRAQQGLMGS